MNQTFPSSTTSAFRMGRRDIVVVTAVLLFALLLRLLFFRGIVSVDDFNYMRHAAEVWRGRFDLGDALYLHATRPLMFVPVAWMFAIFGVSEASAIVWPLIASLASVAFVYLLAGRLYGRACAGAAAVFAAMLPLMVSEGTRLLPGGVTNLIMGASAYCFVVAEQRARRRWWWLLASGTLFGSMQLAGELGLVFGCFFIAAVVLWRHHRVLSYWPAAAGFVVVTAAIMTYHAAATGDPFFKRAISHSILTTQFEALDPLYYMRTLVPPLGGHGGVFYLAGLAVFIDRRRQTMVLAAWFLVSWLFIEYGSSSLTEYRPLYKSVRYLSVVSVPGTVLAGAALVRIVGAAGARRGRAAAVVTAAVVLVAVLALSVATIERGEAWVGEHHRKLLALQERLRARAGETIYVTHWLWNTRVGFFMQYTDDYFPSGYDPYHAVRLQTADADSKNRYVQTLTPGQAMPRGVLLHDERLFEYSRSEREIGSVGPGEIPSQLANIPENWRLIDRIVMSNYNVVALYDVPEGALWPAPLTP